MCKIGALVFTEEREALLTGYKLHLANKEALLLRTIMEHGAIKVSGAPWPNADNVLFSSLPVLVHSINRKSKSICERNLNICKNRNYIINPHM